MSVEFVQLFVSSTLIPNSLAIKVRPNDQLKPLLQLVIDSICTEESTGLKLYHIDSRRWLPNDGDDTVFSFDLMLGGRLDLRSPVRPAKIRFLDDSTKIIKVDETKKVASLIEDICQQLDIEHPEELSLVVAGDYEAPGQARRKSQTYSPGGTLGRNNRPAPFSLDGMAKGGTSPLQTPPGSVRRGSPFAAATSGSPSCSAGTVGRLFTLGRPSSPVSLSPGGSPTLSPAGGAIPRSPSSRRKVLSPSAMSAGKRDSPLLDAKRSNTFTAGMRDSPSLLRNSAKKAAAKVPKNHKYFSKKHGLRLNTPWLAPNLSLHEQEVNKDEELLLMYRCFYWTSLEQNTRRVDMLFMQAKVLFLSGEIDCSESKASQFAALLCQCQHGDYSAEKFTLEWLQEQKQTLLPAKLKAKDAFLQLVLQEHKSLSGMTSSEAKCLLVQLWSTTPIFGYDFFSCAEVQTQKRGLVGVSKMKVIFIPHDSKGDEKKSTKFDLAKLNSWSHSSFLDVVRLTFAKSTLQLLLPEYSAVLADCVALHLKLRDLFKSVPGGLDAEYTPLKTRDEQLSPMASRLHLAIPQAHMEREKSLTFDDVYWSAKIGNPMVSEEENNDIINPGLWHNPVYDKMGDLVDERFQFLDDIDIDDDEEDGDDAPATRATGGKKFIQSGRAGDGGGGVSIAAAAVRAASILAPPSQAPLSKQVSAFTSSNDAASAVTASPLSCPEQSTDQSADAGGKTPAQAAIATTASPTATASASTPPVAERKKKRSKQKKTKDPLTLGQLLAQAGVNDTFTEDGEECYSSDGGSAMAAESPTSQRAPTIVVEDYLDPNAASLEDALWG